MIHAQFNFDKDHYELFNDNKLVTTLSHQDATDLIGGLLLAGVKYKITNHETSYALGELAATKEHLHDLQYLIREGKE